MKDKMPPSVISTLVIITLIFLIFIIGFFKNSTEALMETVPVLIMPLLLLVSLVGVLYRKNWARVCTALIILFFGCSFLIMPFMTKSQPGIAEYILQMVMVSFISWWGYSFSFGERSKKYFGKVPSNEVDKHKLRKIILFGFLVFVIVAVTGVSHYYISKSNTLKESIEFESKLFTRIPSLESLKRHEPETYNRLVGVIKSTKDNGYSLKQKVAMISSEMTNVINNRIPNSSDEAIVNYFEVMIEKITVLQSQGGNLCYQFLYPEFSNGELASAVFTDKLKKKNFAAIDLIIKTSKVKLVPPSENELAPLVSPVFTRLFEKYGDDVDLLDSPTVSGANKDKVCSITKDMYSFVIELPAAQSAQVLRWFYGQVPE